MKWSQTLITGRFNEKLMFMLNGKIIYLFINTFGLPIVVCFLTM